MNCKFERASREKKKQLLWHQPSNEEAILLTIFELYGLSQNSKLGTHVDLICICTKFQLITYKCLRAPNKRFDIFLSFSIFQQEVLKLVNSKSNQYFTMKIKTFWHQNKHFSLKMLFFVFQIFLDIISKNIFLG